MSDIITINTENEITVVEEKIQIYDENFYMLNEVMPEYTEQLPNMRMNSIVRRMKATMKSLNGIGLSANQCGIRSRFFIIGDMVCINPKVISVSDKKTKIDEGCLSFPGLFFKVERPEIVEVEYTNEFGEKVNNVFEGVTARCFLHELDHLNGIKFTKYVGPVAERLARQKQQKIIKKIVRSNKKTS